MYSIVIAFMEIMSLIVSALMIFWCAKIAEKEGRDIPLAALLGFLFGIFAVIGYYIAGDKHD